MTLEKIHEHIDENLPSHIEKIREYIRVPTISSTGEGIREGAELLAGYYRDLGCIEVDIVETSGHPGVFAYYDAGAPKTIVCYAMYDVQPADPSEWSHAPFDADIAPRDPFPSVMYGRGTMQAKGPHRAWLNALESIIAVEGNLPVNIYFVAEGEEEIGSPNFKEIVAPYKDRLQTADASVTFGFGQNGSGEVSLILGYKGFVYFELAATGDGAGRGPQGGHVHASLQGIVGSPAWRLAGALSTLVNVGGTGPAIPGYSDSVRSVAPTDKALAQTLADKLDSLGYTETLPLLASGPGVVDSYADNLSGSDLLARYMFEPTLNINGIYGGYTGPGSITFAVPTEMVANLDARLVPDMEPAPTLSLIRDHLDAHGYNDIEIRVKSAYTWSKTDYESDVVQACLRAYRSLGYDPVIWPSTGVSGPSWYLNRDLGLPTLNRVGLGHAGGFHAPDEFLVIEGTGRVAGLSECEKSHVEILYSFATYPN